MKWIDRIGTYNVEKKEGPRPDGQPYIPLTDPRCIVLHTTEGDSVDGAVATLRSRFSAPHFVVGQNRIVQMRPLDAQAATLVDHNDIGWQIEAVGHSKQTLYYLTPATTSPLVALGAFLTDAGPIPLARPQAWKDNGSDIVGIWAANNSRRKSRTAIRFRGWVGHLDVPDQSPTWHWDPGAFDYTRFFEDIAEQMGSDEMAYEDFKEGWKRFVQGQVAPGQGAPADLVFGYNAAKFAANNPKPDVAAPHTHSVTGTTT